MSEQPEQLPAVFTACGNWRVETEGVRTETGRRKVYFMREETLTRTCNQHNSSAFVLFLAQQIDL